MIIYKSRPEIHPSHKMTEWKTDVVRFIGKPNLYHVRRCEFCYCIQAERHDNKFMDSELTKNCKPNPFVGKRLCR